VASRSPQRRLLRETRATRPYLILACLLGVAAAALIVAQAALLAYVIDRAAMHGASVSSLQPQLIALAAVLVARAGVSGGFELSGRLGATRVMSELRGRLARQLLRVCPDGRPAELRTGDLAAAAVQGVDALESWFAGYLPQLVLAAVVPPAVLVWVLAIDPLPGAILALTVPILIVFMVLIGRGARAQTRRRQQALALLSAHFLDVVRGLPTLIAHRREHAQAATLAQVGERYRRETIATLRVAFMSALVLELCAMIGTALVAATIGVQLVNGVLSLQVGLTVLLLAPELYGPLRGVGQQFHAGSEGIAAAERIFEVLDRPPALRAPARAGAVAAPDPAPVADPTLAAPALDPVTVASDSVPRPHNQPLPDLAHTPNPAQEPIRLEGVAYEYPHRPGPALDELDLELAPGEITALVGPSGAGKSTVARLLLRLADPTSGTVRCGGVDLCELDLARWREQVAWVPQRAQLFTGTVADNIRLGAPHASDAQVARAAELAGASVLIETLPGGMDTLLGEAGRRLSAGQARRIALARAFLREDARLLVLDEPTAHLDERSARDMANVLSRLARGRTTLLIVHHPALAARAHRVLHIAAGRIVPADGSPAPAYAEEVAA
jgi:thiol reductant ABC exporter CydD subunit